MTQQQRIKSALAHMRQCLGAFSVASHGVYCACGSHSPFSITGGMYHNDSVTRFITKYGERFTLEERKAKHQRMHRNYLRFVRLAHKALDCGKLTTAAKLCESAEFERDRRDEIATGKRVYYHLRGI